MAQVLRSIFELLILLVEQMWRGWSDFEKFVGVCVFYSLGRACWGRLRSKAGRLQARRCARVEQHHNVLICSSCPKLGTWAENDVQHFIGKWRCGGTQQGLRRFGLVLRIIYRTENLSQYHFGQRLRTEDNTDNILFLVPHPRDSSGAGKPRDNIWRGRAGPFSVDTPCPALSLV